MTAVRHRQCVLVLPNYNEEATIVGVLQAAAPFVDRMIVVDDGSTDASYELISSWAPPAGCIVDLLRHDRNSGMSGALLSGFARVADLLSDGHLTPDDVVVNLDADGQHDPREIPGAVDYLLERGADVVLGRRELTGYPRYKQVGNALLSTWASVLSGHHYTDVECGFRALRVAAVPDLLSYFTGLRYGCAQEIGVILPLLGFRVDNTLPVSVHFYRQGARFRDGVVNASMGLLAALRVLLRLRAQPVCRARRVLSRSTLLSTQGN